MNDESYLQDWKLFLIETDYQAKLHSPEELARHKRNRLSSKGNVTKGSAPFTEKPPSDRSKSAPPMDEAVEEDILFKPLSKSQKAHASRFIRIKYKDKPVDKDGVIDPKVAKDQQEDEKLYEKKDRCYNIAKRKYKAFPSAYASGAIVKCRQGKIWKKEK